MKKLLLAFINLLIVCNLFGQLIVDDGAFFNVDELDKLKAGMIALESETSIQTLIYTTEDLNGQSSLDYCKSIGSKFGVGQKYINNGIIIFLSRNPRSVQILNGYGLEWILSDKVSSGFVDGMIPFFKESNFGEGILKTLTEISYLTSKYDWIANQERLKSISKLEEGKIVKFKYNNTSGNRKYKYAIETDPQFSEEFYIELEENFHLYYTKYMNDLIGTILSKSDITIYARLIDYEQKRLELIGVK